MEKQKAINLIRAIKKGLIIYAEHEQRIKNFRVNPIGWAGPIKVYSEGDEETMRENGQILENIRQEIADSISDLKKYNKAYAVNLTTMYNKTVWGVTEGLCTNWTKPQ